MGCDATVSEYFPVDTGVRQGCVLAPTLFNTCTDHVLGKMSTSDCGISFGTVRSTDLDFAHDEVIFVRTTAVIVEALDLLSGEAELLGS